ncbi:hypothetical protein KC332_g18285 [Hortaea werneckii]|uniref:SUN-like protein 1 n=2 Tax=Hortaea werneckii TaxID=91943 RepID=A0A3M7I1Y4_HORWE|nr:hypothetical protein KC358_g18447 [Hortaea werneckii]OTA34455.1 hypothetical protein BTJ68_04037 [Hortaea werneckii EXF-2000]KAI6894974.1 hypothetical protein KC348_g18353 [Hortaea werneckii]KAI6924422.1 hypothetical protein KC341_g14069 [Hortaea werneckii]KAI6950359.1 hypothetical protein KC321_g18367 [Hortaea werneckii]
MPKVLRFAACFMLVATTITTGQPDEAVTRLPMTTTSTTTSTITEAASSPGRSFPSTATCISRTVNYITHTLPQQCLRTGRGATNTTQSTGLDLIEAQTSLSFPRTSETNYEGPSIGTASPNPLPGPDCSSSETTTVPSGWVDPDHNTPSKGDPAADPSEGAENAVDVRRVPDPEADSPLDNANFLSFEEWKKQNLAKAGQSSEHLARARQPNSDRQRPGINNVLDTLGDEGEIDIDFAGFGSPRPSETQQASTQETELGADGLSTPPNNVLRSKDAGKTCKERTNYASFDCAATVLKSNPECKHASSILVENKDSYLLNPCSTSNKFLIVELCNEILIDTIVLANYEFFSSIFRQVRVSVADRYPAKAEKWLELGTFEAKNTREVQAFLIQQPLIWARYLRVEFLSHYGMEYYCPLSLLRVHGTTMMEEFRHQEELARGEIDESAMQIDSVSTPAHVRQEASASTYETETRTSLSIPEKSREISSEPDTLLDPITAAAVPSEPLQSISSPTSPQVDDSPTLSEVKSQMLEEISSRSTDGGVSGNTDIAVTSALPTSNDFLEYSTGSKQGMMDQTVFEQNVTAYESSAQSNGSESPRVETETANITTAVPSNPDTASSSSTELSSDTSSIQSGAESKNANSTSANSTALSANSTRTSPTMGPQPPQPSTQESFFKSIHKRLQQLESNSTLSLQYIEEQSRILRDAFQKVEKRQISGTTTFLANLNDTVMAELHGFRQSYDQLWQSTVIELEGQREAYQREMLALSTRLSLVAEELVWQKRMGIVQSTLLLLCLGLVLFGRQGNTGGLEVPLAQQLMLKSQAALRSGWESEEPNSPSSPLNRSPVSLFRRKLWRPISEPAPSTGSPGDVEVEGDPATDSRPGTRDGTDLDVHVQPPTPGMNDGLDQGAKNQEINEVDDDDDDDQLYEDVLMTQSGPATPNGTGAGLKRPLYDTAVNPPDVDY